MQGLLGLLAIAGLLVLLFVLVKALRTMERVYRSQPATTAACGDGEDPPPWVVRMEATRPAVNRHFLLLGMVEETYRDRKDPEQRKRFLEIAHQHVREFADLAEPLRLFMAPPGFDATKDPPPDLPRVPTFQHLATVLTEDGRFDEAVAVCEQAIAYDLHDGTQSGFEGRIQRIRRKQERTGCGRAT